MRNQTEWMLLLPEPEKKEKPPYNLAASVSLFYVILAAIHLAFGMLAIVWGLVGLANSNKVDMQGSGRFSSLIGISAGITETIFWIFH
jgi:hypothetical protein